MPRKADGDVPRFVFDGAEQQCEHVLSTFPSSWFARYLSQGYIDVAPLVVHCSQSIIPAIWHLQPKSGNPAIAQMFDEAREHGLVNGVTCSLYGRNHDNAIFSLVTDSDTEEAKSKIVDQLGAGYMLLIHMHEAMRRITTRQSSPSDLPSLTKRELECLNWVSIGKTSGEIADILKMSERTANFHINNAIRKLDTNSRTQAVARVIFQGLITP